MWNQSAELSRIRFAEPLACGMTGCAEPATNGLLEPDPQTRGLWRLLPVCGACATALREQPREPKERRAQR